jgi:hypothetical protein
MDIADLFGFGIFWWAVAAYLLLVLVSHLAWWSKRAYFPSKYLCEGAHDRCHLSRKEKEGIAELNNYKEYEWAKRNAEERFWYRIGLRLITQVPGELSIVGFFCALAWPVFVLLNVLLLAQVVGTQVRDGGGAIEIYPFGVYGALPLVTAVLYAVAQSVFGIIFGEAAKRDKRRYLALAPLVLAILLESILAVYRAWLIRCGDAAGSANLIDSSLAGRFGLVVGAFLGIFFPVADAALGNVGFPQFVLPAIRYALQLAGGLSALAFAGANYFLLAWHPIHPKDVIRKFDGPRQDRQMAYERREAEDEKSIEEHKRIEEERYITENMKGDSDCAPRQTISYPRRGGVKMSSTIKKDDFEGVEFWQEAAEEARGTEPSGSLLAKPQELFRCSAFYPERIETKTVGTIVVSVHLESAASDVVREAARRIPLPHGQMLKAGSAAPTVRLPRQSLVDINVDVPGLVFETTRSSLHLWEDKQFVEFRFKPTPSSVGQLCRGWVHFWFEGIVLADVSVAILVEVDDIPEIFRNSLAESNARPYRYVFPSYSHQDKEAVERLEAYAESFGDTYLRDVRSLRAGQEWNEELRGFIKRADVFQLFWSVNAARSNYVRNEWQCALSERTTRPDPYFLRPIYWTETPAEIPKELEPIHFAKVPLIKH